MYRNQQQREGNWDSNQQFGAEGRNKQPEQNEETRIQKLSRGLGTSRTTLDVPTSKSYGCQKKKRKNKKLKTYLKT